MDSRDTARTLRSREFFLETVAFGSLLVFASVMPPLSSVAPPPPDHGAPGPATPPDCPEPRAL